MSKQPSLYNFFKPLGSKSSPDVNKSADSSNSAKKTPKAKSQEFEVCDIVWAKLDGYPWWPGLVCGDPKTKKHVKGNDVHIQFFDDPPSRSWIYGKKSIEKYTPDSNKKKQKGYNQEDMQKLEKACKEADEAYLLSIDERNKFLIDFNNVSPSDDEKKNESSPGTDKENNDGTTSPPKKKKKLFVFDSEDSEDEYKPEKVEESDDEDVSSDNVSEEEVEEIKSEPEEEIEDSPPRGVKRKRNQPTKSNKKMAVLKATPTSSPRASFSSPLSESTKARLSLFRNTPDTPKAKDSSEEKLDDWPHLKYDFLQPEKIMDKKRRKTDHPDYDKRTLYVPEDFKSKVTPAQRQWWEIKSDHFDCVLFFKMGKFYELYHMDAVIGVNELSLTMMRGETAHCGFPEAAYGKYSNMLVQKGHKIARIEQTETPDVKNERCRQQLKTSKFDKVVKRELCQITTKGTQIFSFIDGEAKESETNYLLALTEKADSFAYGVCFIDTSIGTFHIGQFSDDKYSSRLRTLLSHYPPVQIIYEKNHLSKKTMQLLKTYSSVMQEALAPETEFWTAGNTLKTLAEEKHFESSNGIGWPEAIKKFISENDSIGLTASDDGELALKSLGAVIWYLKNCLLDQQIIAMKKFEVYTPVDVISIAESEDAGAKVDLGRYMILDGITIANLEVLANSDGGMAGSLLEKMDRCCTFSGKRLMREWLCTPLCNISAILSRQKAVSELIEKHHIVDEVRSALKSIPDLERLLAKIHTQGNAIRSQTHPDSRASFFEEKSYSKRKILDFLSALNGFQKLQNAFEIFRKEATPDSVLLKQCILHPPEGRFFDLSEHLKFFEEAFDHDLAKKEGTIIPKSSGVDVDYDNVMEELRNIEKESGSYLRTQCQHFGGATVKYFGTDKHRFQLEIPENQAKRADSSYEFTSARKGFKRFVTKQTKEFLKRQMEAEDTKSTVLKDLSRRIFAQFSDKYEEWNIAIQCMAMLDVLMSIAEYCRTEEGDMALPEFEEPKSNSKPFVDIRNGRHPCISTADNFIPNDSQLGIGEFCNLVLLTGPNMGGKSTLMRQLGLIVIMAHMGSLVPASSCRLVPVDRIFTRIGANDDILAGESTFFVELSETSLFLNHATKFSLVLVDELGRGTSTYDGTAIAYSVVNELADRQCRTLFSTHYHTLVEDFKNSESVSLGHMACMVETDEDDPSEETVTFLYKFSKGACPKSHGFNAAKLAGVPTHIIKVGKEKAEILEKENERRKLLRKLWDNKINSPDDLSLLVESIKLVI